MLYNRLCEVYHTLCHILLVIKFFVPFLLTHVFSTIFICLLEYKTHIYLSPSSEPLSPSSEPCGDQFKGTESHNGAKLIWMLFMLLQEVTQVCNSTVIMYAKGMPTS